MCILFFKPPGKRCTRDQQISRCNVRLLHTLSIALLPLQGWLMLLVVYSFTKKCEWTTRLCGQSLLLKRDSGWSENNPPHAHRIRGILRLKPGPPLKHEKPGTMFQRWSYPFSLGSHCKVGPPHGFGTTSLTEVHAIRTKAGPKVVFPWVALVRTISLH